MNTVVLKIKVFGESKRALCQFFTTPTRGILFDLYPEMSNEGKKTFIFVDF